MSIYDLSTMRAPQTGYVPSPYAAMPTYGITSGSSTPSQFPGMQPAPGAANFMGMPDTKAPGGDWSWLDTFKNGQKDQQGMLGVGLGAAQGIFNAYMGMKQYGLAKDQFAESKKQFGLNYDAQARTTNASLADRQRARLSADPNGYQSVADYMAQYGVPGRG